MVTECSVCHPCVVEICGVAADVNRDKATFHIDAEQWVSATSNTETFPVHCLIPHNAKFKKYKPIPSKGKPVSVTGFLTGLERNGDQSIKHFIVDVDAVTFMGTGQTAPEAKQSPAKIAKGTPASLKFTGFFGSQGASTDTNSGEPPSKRRKTADDRAAEEAAAEEDKAEGSLNSRSRRRD
ncbi:hypothetical protein B0H13DRAFT_2317808 [Mycena leptocephala]|nr:hypothetical protein B0H13DRAFT_2317808 [Mycena leptocephala]